MKTEALKFNNAALEAIHALRIQVELNEKVNLRCKTTDELVQLMEIASRSASLSIQGTLARFVENLSQRQATFFASVGVNFEPLEAGRVVEKSYRGVKQQNAKQEMPVGETPPAERVGKRKVIYRGQVKWI